MAKEYRAKVFKSGNSLALRIPKELGLVEGSTMILREERAGFVVEPLAQPKRKFNVAKVAGSAKNLSYIRDEDRLFDDRPLSWGSRLTE
ncbi:AbrB/MazE/SpoVT family DNA-binding domain-containing protein [Novosphingobium sp.]|uniref:AbrB/MazE/SpoVT family DNA-binding domain-containing protein n=1 Tax=Novosphingobium sp. TaxID=1874826 RepID=UPI00262A08FB|nr:AbrB/MazE/SpoVT family DNA-binding domain-containing protein [Novosphingobium sp.]